MIQNANAHVDIILVYFKKHSKNSHIYKIKKNPSDFLTLLSLEYLFWFGLMKLKYFFSQCEYQFQVTSTPTEKRFHSHGQVG